jgi:hypothetical protein
MTETPTTSSEILETPKEKTPKFLQEAEKIVN